MAFYDDNTPAAETVPAGPQFGSADYNFDFLDSYLQQVSKPSRTNPYQSLDDGDNFYTEEDNEESQAAAPVNDTTEEQSPDGSAGFSESAVNDYLFSSDTAEEEEVPDYRRYNDEEEVDTNDDETEPGEIVPFDNFPAMENGWGLNKSQMKTPFATVNNRSALGEGLGKTESGGKYNATNKHSSAAGKYQFLWGTWGDSIKKVTGVKSKQEFLDNPAAQEKYYSFYEKNVLQPGVTKLKNQLNTDLSDTQLARLIHFRGQAGAKKYLRGQISDKPEAYNMKISDYIGKKQTGGNVLTPQEQQELHRPFVKPKEIEKVEFQDNRKINPVTGKPFKKPGTRNSSTTDDVIKTIVSHAKAQNVDPYTALAVSLQETNFGQGNDDYGHIINDSPLTREKYGNLSNQDWYGAALASTINEKLAYGKQLGYDKKGEDYQLQAYNGYGKLTPNTESNYYERQTPSFYGVPVSKNKPLDLSKNPAWGKTVISLRDSVIKPNPRLKEIIDATPAFDYEKASQEIINNQRQTGGYGVAITPEEQHIGLNNPDYDHLFIPLQGTTTIRGLDDGSPVEVIDEEGTRKVLRGPKHTFKAKGSVKEKRLKN